MATRVSKDSRRKISASLEREEEERKAQRKAMDERELRRLTRQTRMMKEASLKDVMTEKQTKVKNILNKENDNLVDNLNLMKSRRRCDLDNKQAQDIANLIAQGDNLDAAITLEKKYIEDLESQIQKDSQNIQVLKKKKGDITGNSDYFQKKEKERADRTLESWKSRLAAEQTQLALTTKDNEEMREKFRRLLKEKGHFNKLFEELMGKLKRGKGVMADVVERSHQQFQKRDEVSRKIEALKSRDSVDLGKRMQEMQELEMKLYEDRQLASFRYRVQQMRARLTEGKKTSTKGTIEQEKLTIRLEMANDFWEKLKETTGLSRSEEISNYIKTEDSNLFRLFNFNNEVRDQLEVLTHKTAELVSSVHEESIAAEEHLEQIVKDRNSLQKKLLQIEHNFNDLNDVYGANARLFSRLLNKIKNLFDLMKCKTITLEDLLGDNMEVSEHNYRLYLNLIETELISALEAVTIPTVGQQSSAGTSATKSERSLYKTKTDVRSILSRRMVTLPCFECEVRWKAV